MSSKQEWPLVRLSDAEMSQVVGSAGTIPPEVWAALPAEGRAILIRVVC